MLLQRRSLVRAEDIYVSAKPNNFLCLGQGVTHQKDIHNYLFVPKYLIYLIILFLKFKKNVLLKRPYTYP